MLFLEAVASENDLDGGSAAEMYLSMPEDVPTCAIELLALGVSEPVDYCRCPVRTLQDSMGMHVR